MWPFPTSTGTFFMLTRACMCARVCVRSPVQDTYVRTHTHTHSWVILILFRFCACEFTHSLKLIGNPSRHPGPDRPGGVTVLAGPAASVPSPAQAPVGVSEGGGWSALRAGSLPVGGRPFRSVCGADQLCPCSSVTGDTLNGPHVWRRRPALWPLRVPEARPGLAEPTQ